MKDPFLSDHEQDDGISSVFTPLIDALFLILVALLAGYIVYIYEFENQAPNPIDLPAEQFFALGSWTLDSLSQENLKRVLSMELSQKIDSLNMNDGRLLKMLSSINIEGYADAVPVGRNSELETNEEYSYHRALGVYRVLDELNTELDWGLPDSLFLVAGYGDRKLRIQTTSAEPRNRRIVIRFIFEDERITR